MIQILRRRCERSLSSYAEVKSSHIYLYSTFNNNRNCTKVLKKSSRKLQGVVISAPPSRLTKGWECVFSSFRQTEAAHLCSCWGLTFPHHCCHSALRLENECQLHTMKNVRQIMEHCSMVPSVIAATPYFFLSLSLFSVFLSFFVWLTVFSFLSCLSVFIPTVALIQRKYRTIKQQNRYIVTVVYAHCGSVLIPTLDISSLHLFSVSFLLPWQAWDSLFSLKIACLWRGYLLSWFGLYCSGLEKLCFSWGMSLLEQIHQYSF